MATTEATAQTIIEQPVKIHFKLLDEGIIEIDALSIGGILLSNELAEMVIRDYGLLNLEEVCRDHAMEIGEADFYLRKAE